MQGLLWAGGNDNSYSEPIRIAVYNMEHLIELSNNSLSYIYLYRVNKQFVDTIRREKIHLNPIIVCIQSILITIYYIVCVCISYLYSEN